MNDLHELHEELLIKDYPNGDREYRLVDENERLVTGSITKVARFISNNELFDISVNGNSGKYLAKDWRYATENEVSMCLTEAKLFYAFKESEN